MEALRYRPELTGLRAVAVVPIVLVHAGVAGFVGGTFGVDVFFVLSGYLITAILVRDTAADPHDLREFYRRRAVRLLPALVVMLVAALIAGYLVLQTDELRALGIGAAATAGFGANILYYRSVGYFAPVAAFEPLLHCWSLGVEEQFYLLYPAFLLLCRRRWPKRTSRTLAMVTLVSLIVAVGLVASARANSGFYLLPGRAWELTLGGLVACNALPRIDSARLRHGSGAIGLTAILVAVLAIDPTRGTATLWAILPCCGTALLLAYGTDGPVARLLSLAPLRWIGTISYGLYLWHLPILAFWRIDHGAIVDGGVAADLIGVAVLAATLSWWMVERPAARRWRQGPPGIVVRNALLAMAALAAVAFAVAATTPHWQRVDPRIGRYIVHDFDRLPDFAFQYRPGRCFVERDQVTVADACLMPAADRPNVLLFGDSHAADLWRAVAERHPALHVMQATRAGCQPLLAQLASPTCGAFVRQVLGSNVLRGWVSRVVLTGQWNAGEIPALVATIGFFQRRHVAVTVLGVRLRYAQPLPRMLARALRRHDTVLRLPADVGATRAVDRGMRAAVEAAGARYVSIYDILCPADRCRVLAPDGSPIYADGQHLSLPGARWLALHVRLA